MNKLRYASFSDLLTDIGRAFGRIVRTLAAAIATMSWPALLATSIMLAFAITIVPLALFLFIVFMALKLAIAAIIISKRGRGGE
jgi:hypothetical protein